MNGTSWTNPRFARNENAVLVASVNTRWQSRKVAAERAKMEAGFCRMMDREMRNNTARFL